MSNQKIELLIVWFELVMKWVIRMELESIYDLKFPNTLHFRVGRDCHWSYYGWQRIVSRFNSTIKEGEGWARDWANLLFTTTQWWKFQAKATFIVESRQTWDHLIGESINTIKISKCLTYISMSSSKKVRNLILTFLVEGLMANLLYEQATYG